MDLRRRATLAIYFFILEMFGSVSSVFAKTVSGTVGMFANSCKFTDKDVIRFMLKCVLPREKYKCYLSIEMMLSPETVVKGQVSHRTVVLSFDNLGEKKAFIKESIMCVPSNSCISLVSVGSIHNLQLENSGRTETEIQIPKGI